MARMSRADWNKTPYAGSTAKDADGAITALLAKYKVTETQITSCRGPNLRPAYMLRFVLKGKCYRIAVETLDAWHVSEAELMLQAKRAVFYFLKSTLEMTTTFFPAEQVLFAFLEVPRSDGETQTMFEGARPYIAQLTAPNFGRLMLPPARPPEEGKP